MRFAYKIKKSIKIESLGGFLPSLSPFLLPLSDFWTGLHPQSIQPRVIFQCENGRGRDFSSVVFG